MELTVAQALDIADAVESVSKTPMNAKLAYRVERVGDKVSPIVKSYKKKNQDLIISKHGVKGEDDKVTVPTENLEAFYKDIQEILEQKEEVNLFQFSVDDFDGVAVTPDFFKKIKSILKEEATA